MTRRGIGAAGLAVVGFMQAAAMAHPPEPIGTANITMRWMTMHGHEEVLTDVRDFTGRDHEDAVPLDGDHHINCFFSVNSFGIRTDVRGAIQEDESLIAHAFFKDHHDHSHDYFHMIESEDTRITIEITGIHFEHPVTVVRPTILLHKFWDADQVDRLSNFYINLHNYGLSTDLWRDFGLFFPNTFSDFPVPNYDLGEATSIGDVTVIGDGTNEISIIFSFPYSVFKHYEETGQDVPDGLPAPFGYLEPFHFHMEWIARGHDPYVPCEDVKKFKANCSGRKIKAKVVAKRLDPGTLVTIDSDGEWHAIEIGEDGKGSTSFKPRRAGEHEVFIADCPDRSVTVTCGG
ncbi:MAG: hypothetical protein BroJett003_07020 [Planctomycetota bacterium]|nr:MAG: hypothetical protein BroJett003_07020 [Planctomycetota bacterium]